MSHLVLSYLTTADNINRERPNSAIEKNRELIRSYEP